MGNRHVAKVLTIRVDNVEGGGERLADGRSDHVDVESEVRGALCAGNNVSQAEVTHLNSAHSANWRRVDIDDLFSGIRHSVVIRVDDRGIISRVGVNDDGELELRVDSGLDVLSRKLVDESSCAS